MKKIVFVHLFNDRSGSPKVLSQVIKSVSRSGKAVEILTSYHSDGFLSDLPGTRRLVFYRRYESKLLTLICYFLSQVSLFLNCLRYWRQDVFFYINTIMPFGAALAARVMGKQVLYHVHETSIRPALLKRFLRLVMSLTASKVIFVSTYLLQTDGFENKRQYIVHNAFDPEFSRSLVKQQGEFFTVLMVCSLKKYKGVLEFFDLAHLFVSQPSVRFTLILNADQPEIDAYFSGRAISSNVKIFPRQSNVSKFYTDASLLLNLSRPDECVETFGLTILEGMAYGLPVIVPPIGGPAEIVTDGQEGFLISCYETGKISAVIEKLSSDPDLHWRLACNAQARAKDFNLANFEEKIAEIIEL